MRKITKGNEPAELMSWKRKNPRGRYDDLSHLERGAINQATRKEQFGLCAYCCKKIGESDSMNEHVEAQNIAKNRTLDFSNIVASCITPKQCDAAHGSQPLPLTPLMVECETELKFYFSGEVEGLTDRAKQAIDVLNLNNQSLIAKRKQQIKTLVMPPDTTESVLFWDSETIELFISEYLQKVDNDGKLEAYSPVLVNVLRQKLYSKR